MASKRKTKKDAPKRGRGRPRTQMTDENIAAILRTVALGVWPDRAAQMHGVNASTMRSFKEANEDFRTALEKADAQAESGFLGKILRHTENQWTAAAWMLERRWPARWAKRDSDHDDAKKASAKQSDDTDKWREMMAAIPGRVMPTAPAAPTPKPAEDDSEC